MTDQHTFINRLRILASLDYGDIPELTPVKWAIFRDDPYRYLIRADDPTADAIWRAIVKRETRCGKHRGSAGSHSGCVLAGRGDLT